MLQGERPEPALCLEPRPAAPTRSTAEARMQLRRQALPAAYGGQRTAQGIIKADLCGYQVELPQLVGQLETALPGPTWQRPAALPPGKTLRWVWTSRRKCRVTEVTA